MKKYFWPTFLTVLLVLLALYCGSVQHKYQELLRSPVTVTNTFVVTNTIVKTNDLYIASEPIVLFYDGISVSSITTNTYVKLGHVMVREIPCSNFFYTNKHELVSEKSNGIQEGLVNP